MQYVAAYAPRASAWPEVDASAVCAICLSEGVVWASLLNKMARMAFSVTGFRDSLSLPTASFLTMMSLNPSW